MGKSNYHSEKKDAKGKLLPSNVTCKQCRELASLKGDKVPCLLIKSLKKRLDRFECYKYNRWYPKELEGYNYLAWIAWSRAHMNDRSVGFSIGHIATAGYYHNINLLRYKLSKQDRVEIYERCLLIEVVAFPFVSPPAEDSNSTKDQQQLSEM